MLKYVKYFLDIKINATFHKNYHITPRNMKSKFLLSLSLWLLVSCDNRLYNVSYINFAFIEGGTIVREYNSVVYAPYWACGDVIYNSVNDIFYNIQEENL